MLSFKRSSLLLFGLLLTVFVAACSNPLSNNTTTGSTNTTKTTKTTTTKTTSSYGKTSNTTSTTPMAKPTTVAQKNNTMGTQTTMGGNMAGSNNALIHTTMVKLNGKMITILTNAKGMVLYYKLNDPRPASACTGTCATAWPPVIANTMNMMMVSSSMQLPHKLTVYKTANGSQIEYDGHPLYTYAGDMTPGMFAGRGIGNVWYLVSLGL